MVIAGSMEGLLLLWVPILGTVLLLLFVGIRIILGKMGDRLIWRVVKYATISFGGAGFIVMGLASTTPGYIRKTEQFQAEMKKEADIPAIWQWAESYKVEPTSKGDRVSVDAKNWPDCVRRLKPNFVLFNPDKKIMWLWFGSGFGGWGLAVGPKGDPADRWVGER